MGSEKVFKDSDYYNEYFAVHNCTLPPQTDIVSTYIDSGMFVNTRRKLRSFFTVDENSKVTKTHLRSRAKVRHEKMRHLQYHYYMIHPFSKARAYWELFMIVVLFFVLLIIPTTHVFGDRAPFITLIQMSLNIFCIMDIIVTFISGYYEHITRTTVLNCQKVAKHYLKGYFIIDILSSIPVVFFTIIFSIGYKKYLWLLDLFSYLKLLRLTTLIKYLDRLRIRNGYSIYKFRNFKLFIIFVTALFWATSQLYTLNHESHMHEKDIYHMIACSCFMALCRFLLIGYNVHASENHEDQLIYSIISLFFGVALRLYIYAETLQLLNKNLSSSNNYQQMLQQLTEYVRYKQLPSNMRKRIFKYFEYRFENNYYRESDMMAILSENLRQEMLLHSCRRLVENVEFFHDIPANLVGRLVKYMKTEIYLTNDVIVRAGFGGDTMYFIASGTIAVYTSGGKEICHLSDGGHFGEIALLINSEQRVATVVAVECCDLYALNGKDFRRAISPYPEFANRIKKMAQIRLEKTMNYITGEKLPDAKRHPS